MFLHRIQVLNVEIVDMGGKDEQTFNTQGIDKVADWKDHNSN